MKCNSIFKTILFSFVFLFLVPFNVLAANYGEGNYGAGNYNVGDSTAPAGGSITYLNGSQTSLTVALTVSDGTDADSGVDTSSRIVQRKSASLDGDTCGNYGSFGTISHSGTYPNFTDSTVASGNCYQYKYLVSDTSTNQATYTSSNIVKITYQPPEATSCTTTKPSGISTWLYSAVSNSSNSVTLRFTNYQTPIDHFVIEYGTKTGEYKYSVDNIDKNATSYTVNKLNSNTTYFFRIRTGNGCATGSWSNEISSKTLGFVTFNNLDIIESELESVVADNKNNGGSCKTYTVKSGDTLWKVSSNLLGDGSRYQEIADANSNNYPSLKTSTSLKIGWELKVNCAITKTTFENDDNAIGGYDVNIKVTNTKQEPVAGAKVTIHSDPKETTTDENGIAKFTRVESGNHKVLIAYNNFEGEQSINLTGDTKEFNLNITVNEKKVLLSPFAYGVIGLLVLVITILIIKLQKKRDIKRIV